MRYRVLIILITLCFNIYGETNIIFIHSSPQSFPWSIGVNNGINQAILDYPGWTVFSESIDDPLVDISSNPEFWLDYIKSKFSSVGIDGVLVEGNVAGNLIKKYGQELFGNIPIITHSNINKSSFPNYYILSSDQNNSIIETLKLAIKQNPNKKKLVIINGEAPIYKSNKGEINNILKSVSIELREINNFTYQSLLESISNLNGDEIVLYFLVRKDSEGKSFVPQKILKEISDISPSPIYTFWSSLMDTGAVGGVMVDSITVTQEMFRALNDYLEYNRYGNDYKSTHVFLNWESMTKYNIDKSNNLDYSSTEITYLNEPIPIFDIYYKEILLGGIIFLFVFILALTLVFIKINKQRKELDTAVSYQKDLLLQQEHLEADLIEASKLSSLGMMVAGVAHELNTPLGAAMLVSTEIVDDCNFVKRSIIDSLHNNILSNFINRTIEGLNLIISNQNRQAVLIEGFKRLSYERTKSEMKPFKIINLLMDLEQMIKPLLKSKNVKLSISAGEELEINSLYGPLSQILQNLIINSLQHGFYHKINSYNKIKISVEEIIDDEILIEVSDNGDGISDDIIDKVFDPFITTNRNSGNTGLGLNFVYKWVTNSLKGSISVKKSSNSGTTFEIKIPRDLSKVVPEC